MDEITNQCMVQMDVESIEFNLLTKEDLELVRNWRNSPEVSKYMYTSDYISPEQQKQWFNKISSDDSQRYWIFSNGNRKLGVVSIYDIDCRNKSCNWAFYLAEPVDRGLRIGSKVEFYLLDYVFNTLKLNKLRGEVLAFNSNVVAMHEKFGFRREGYFRQHIFKDGIYHDVIAIGMLKCEWDYLRDYNYNRIYGRTAALKQSVFSA